ncbi:MAG: hypothetical protein AAGB00_07105 [Planctomycetota bacterium]
MSLDSGKARASWAVLLAVAGVSAIGCGSELATVTGQVTLNGEPVIGGGSVRGTVYFFPEGGTGAPAVGLIDETGSYRVTTGSMRGVEPGTYLVTISASEIVPSKVVGAAPAGRVITPRKYADPSKSGFRVDVGAGANEFDFDLVAERSRRRR